MSSLLYPHIPRDPEGGAASVLQRGGPVGFTEGRTNPRVGISYDKDETRRFHTRGFRAAEGVTEEQLAEDAEHGQAAEYAKHTDLEKFFPLKHETLYLLGQENWRDPFVIAHEARHTQMGDGEEMALWDAFRAVGTEDWTLARDNLMVHTYGRRKAVEMSAKERDEEALAIIDKERDNLIDQEATAFVSEILESPEKARPGTDEFTNARIRAWREYLERRPGAQMDNVEKKKKYEFGVRWD